MNSRGWNAVLRVAQLSAGIVVLFWLLSKLQPTPRHLALLGIFSAGLLLLIEAILIHGRIRGLQGQLSELRDDILRKLQNSTPEREKERDALDFERRVLLLRRNWFLRAGASLVLILAGFISYLSYSSFCQAGKPHSAVHLSDQMEKALIDYLSATSKVRGPAPPDGGVLKLDVSLEAALRQHLQNSNPTQNLPAPSSVPHWSILALIVLVSGMLIGGIWWSLRKKPGATPLTVALATLTAVSGIIAKLADKEQTLHFGGVPWWIAIVTSALLVVGIILLLAGGWRLLGLRRLPDEDFLAREALLGAALLVFGFSATLLALVPPLLFHVEAVLAKPCPHCPTQGAMHAQKIEAFALDGIDDLGDGRRPEDKSIDRKKIQQLTSGLAKADTGDILLLLGSADCRATRPKNKGGLWDSNKDLANARANWVKDSLQDQLVKGVNIMALPLPQHARCGVARNVRAVFPFFIHGESN